MKTFLAFLFSCSFLMGMTQVNSPKEENQLENKAPSTKKKAEASEPSSPSSTYDLKDSNKKQVKMSYQENSVVFQQKLNQVTRNPSSRTIPQEEVVELQRYLTHMSALEPKNVNTYLGFYQVGQHDTKNFDALKKAYDIAPNNPEVLKQMIAFYGITGKIEQEREMLVSLFKQGVYPLSNLHYGKDLIKSVDKDAVLVLHGFEDYCAVRYVQLVQLYRSDLTIVQLDFLNSDFYRKKLASDGFEIPKSETIDPPFFQEFCNKNENRRIHASLTLAPPFLKIVVGQINVKGLTVFYSRVYQDLYAVNLDLWHNKLGKELISSKDNPLVTNYLPMLYQLRGSKKKIGYQDSKDIFSETITEIVNARSLPEKSKSY